MTDPTSRPRRLGAALAIAIAALLGACAGGGEWQATPTGILFGDVQLVDVDTGHVRALDRQCPGVIQAGGRRVEFTTRPGGTYQVQVPEMGKWPLELNYRGRVLETEIQAFETPNRIDIFIEYSGDRYRLRVARSARVDPPVRF